jgi:hypothetical protein
LAFLAQLIDFMKKYFFMLPVPLLLVIFSCNKIDDLLTFTVTDHSTITIENNTINLPFELPTPEITSTAKQEFQNNNTRADLVKDVKLSELTMQIESPAGKTFSFLKSIHIYISTDGTDKVLLAYHENIPATATTVELITSDEKLDKYVKADSYKLHTTVVTKETLTQSVDIGLTLKFRVTADPL